MSSDLLAQLVIATGLGGMDVVSYSTTIAAGDRVNATVSVRDQSYCRIVWRIGFGAMVPGQIDCLTLQEGGIRPHQFTVSQDVIRAGGVPIWLYITQAHPMRALLINNNASASMGVEMTFYALDVARREEHLEIQQMIAHLTGRPAPTRVSV